MVDDVDVASVDVRSGTVKFTDNSIITMKEFRDMWIEYFTDRIAGETLLPSDMERFMRRTSSKNLKQLVDGKKMEGYQEATMGKKMNPEMVRIIMIVIILAVVGIIAVIVMKTLGIM